MNQDLKIIRALIPGYQELQEITVDSKGLIISQQAWVDNFDDKCMVIDLEEDWLSLGGVDLQINGGLGFAFTDLTTAEPLSKIAEYLASQGIDAFLPTIITTDVSKIKTSLSIIADYMSQQDSRHAEVLGVHLEGPFLNPEKRGAHPPQYLLPLTLENVYNLLGEYTSIIKIITLAPELDSTGTVIPYLVNQGIVVSLGHSLATSEEAKRAFSQGATMVTHAFNAMPSLHHRQPGLLAEAIIDSRVKCGLIADGYHVSPTMIKLLLKASSYQDGVFLVSDALAPLGLGNGCYPWDNRQIVVKDGTARLEDGTLAGTTLPLLASVENLVKWGICDLSVAITLATTSPRQALSLPLISPAQPARFLRWHWDNVNHQLIWSRIKLTNY